MAEPGMQLSPLLLGAAMQGWPMVTPTSSAGAMAGADQHGRQPPQQQNGHSGSVGGASRVPWSERLGSTKREGSKAGAEGNDKGACGRGGGTRVFRGAGGGGGRGPGRVQEWMCLKVAALVWPSSVRQNLCIWGRLWRSEALASGGNLARRNRCLHLCCSKVLAGFW